MTDALDQLSDHALDLLIGQQHATLVLLDDFMKRADDIAAGYRKLMAEKVGFFHKLMALHNHRHPNR